MVFCCHACLWGCRVLLLCAAFSILYTLLTGIGPPSFIPFPKQSVMFPKVPHLAYCSVGSNSSFLVTCRKWERGITATKEVRLCFCLNIYSQGMPNSFFQSLDFSLVNHSQAGVRVRGSREGCVPFRSHLWQGGPFKKRPSPFIRSGYHYQSSKTALCFDANRSDP